MTRSNWVRLEKEISSVDGHQRQKALARHEADRHQARNHHHQPPNRIRSTRQQFIQFWHNTLEKLGSIIIIWEGSMEFWIGQVYLTWIALGGKAGRDVAIGYSTIITIIIWRNDNVFYDDDQCTDLWCTVFIERLRLETEPLIDQGYHFGIFETVSHILKIESATLVPFPFPLNFLIWWQEKQIEAEYRNSGGFETCPVAVPFLGIESHDGWDVMILMSLGDLLRIELPVFENGLLFCFDLWPWICDRIVRWFETFQRITVVLVILWLHVHVLVPGL